MVAARLSPRTIIQTWRDILVENPGVSIVIIGTVDDLMSREYAIAVGETFAPTYTELLRRAASRTFGEQEKRWQMLRRGRYVEFNLVWDRGTKFGLETNGRTESILMSMPPTAQWGYNLQPEPGSAEAETQAWLRKGVNWV